MTNYAVKIEDLSVTFGKNKKAFKAVKNVSYKVKQGEILGVVGESGSGKSVSSLALMGLLPKTAKIEAKSLEVGGLDFLNISAKQKRKALGTVVSIVFQDALNSLDPTYTIGEQIIEVLRLHHKGWSEKDYKEKAISLLKEVGITHPESRLSVFPHQMSGGMLQRVMIAIAISSNPKVLICDEPTTALDVIIQNQIVELLLKIKKQNNMTLIFISHDLALISEISDHIIVMKNGEVVERGSVEDIFLHPKEDYTINLINSLPQFARNLKPIPIG